MWALADFIRFSLHGSNEGMYAWVVANYALGTLGGDPLDITGIIELGGAFAQVTFLSREPILSRLSCAVKFGNTTYKLQPLPPQLSTFWPGDCYFSLLCSLGAFACVYLLNTNVLYLISQFTNNV